MTPSEKGRTARQEALLMKMSPLDIARKISDHNEPPFRRQELLDPSEVEKEEIFSVERARILALEILDSRAGQTLSLGTACQLRPDHQSVFNEATDGSHRFHGVIIVCGERGIPNKRLICDVMYGLNRREIIRSQIAASSARSIKVARMSGWINELWGLTPYGREISATSAFTKVYSEELKKGSRPKRNPKRSDEISAAVHDIASLADITIPTLRSYLHISDITSPELIARVRLGGSFIEGGLSLTLGQLETIADPFPNQIVLHKRIANFVNAKGLSTHQIADLVEDLKQKDYRDIRVVDEFLNSEKWKSRTSDHVTSPKRVVRQQIAPDLSVSQAPHLLSSRNGGQLDSQVARIRTSPEIRNIAQHQLAMIRIAVDSESRTPSMRSSAEVYAFIVRMQSADGSAERTDAQNAITESYNKLSPTQRSWAVEQLTDACFDPIEAVRDSAITILSFLKWDNLAEDRLNFIVGLIALNCQTAALSATDCREISGMMDSLMPVLDKLSDVRNLKIPHMLALLKTIDEASYHCDNLTQKSLREWLDKNR